MKALSPWRRRLASGAKGRLRAMLDFSRVPISDREIRVVASSVDSEVHPLCSRYLALGSQMITIFVLKSGNLE
jgi:hypothetical protein